MHDHDGKGSNSMMWMMVICCAIPLLLILVLGSGGKALGTPTWIVLGGVAVMVVAHFFMMGRSHKHSDEEPSTTDGQDKNKDHSGHGCCH